MCVEDTSKYMKVEKDIKKISIVYTYSLITLYTRIQPDPYKDLIPIYI